MGELDLCKDCGSTYSPFVEVAQSAMIMVFISWLPLVIAGLALGRNGVVHATMRGAGPLGMLARLAIATLATAVAMPVLMLTALFTELAGSVPEGFLFLIVGLAIMLPVAAISAAGIKAWHRVLIELTSQRGATRMLV
jgi:hypothetical protein